MKTQLFDFHLPESLIASEPANPRDSARMLLVSDVLQDKTIRDLPSFLKPGDVMVFNDTKVIPARLLGKRGVASVEILLHKPLIPSPLEGEGCWVCFAKPAKRLKIADRIIFAPDFHAVVVDKLADGQVVLQFDSLDFYGILSKYGAMPLPPYIEKKRNLYSPGLQGEQEGGSFPPLSSPANGRGDSYNYQTIYAKHEGSVAAPTAGLHFTDSLLAAIDAAGVKRVQVTLHVGGGTFLPVKTEDTKDHVMHSEYAELSAETADTINVARKSGGRVIAVGTTSMRTLESAAVEHGNMQPMARETNIFITPGYRFKTTDVLLTNFHLPKSTLFMLVSAFSGLEQMHAAYQHAIHQNYRFYSYGDACLLYKNGW